MNQVNLLFRKKCSELCNPVHRNSKIYSKLAKFPTAKTKNSNLYKTTKRWKSIWTNVTITSLYSTLLLNLVCLYWYFSLITDTQNFLCVWPTNTKNMTVLTLFFPQNAHVEAKSNIFLDENPISFYYYRKNWKRFQKNVSEKNIFQKMFLQKTFFFTSVSEKISETFLKKFLENVTEKYILESPIFIIKIVWYYRKIKFQKSSKFMRIFYTNNPILKMKFGNTHIKILGVGD